MGRLAGIDYGTRRIGVAISDPGQRIASPATTLDATGSPTNDADRLLAWAVENEITGFVIGLPLNMHDASDSDQTRITRTFAAALAERTPQPVYLWDERLSSYQADQFMNMADVPRSRRKALRDALAAQVILQAFLDAQ